MKKTIEKFAKVFVPKQTDDGAEVVCDKPKFIKTGVKKPPTQQQIFKRLMAQHKELELIEGRVLDETDFDIDEPDILTAYERTDILYETVQDTHRNDPDAFKPAPATPIAEEPSDAPQDSNQSQEEG